MSVLYPARITKSLKDQRYTVEFLDLPEAITEGESLAEALFNATEVLTLSLEGRMDEGLNIPESSLNINDADVYSIAPSARVQAALLIKIAKKGHTTAELARALQTSWPAVARLEDPHHWPTLRQLEKYAAVLGKKLILSMESI